MTQIMTVFLRLGLMASVMALFVLGVRACLWRAPKIYTYVLWIFVFIRAVLPVSYSPTFSPWSFFQKSPSASGPAVLSARMADTASAHLGKADAARKLTQNAAAAQNLFQKTAPDVWTIAAAVWVFGLFVLLFYSLASLLKLRKAIRFSVLVQERAAKNRFSVYESDQIKTAFILGFFHPAVYLPAGLSQAQKRLILEHESVHLFRHDHQIKIAVWMILVLHWFHPLLWVSFYFFCKDMELSCDEQVLKNLGTQVRADYSLLLLKLASPGNLPSGIPLAFCSSHVKIRIQNVLQYRPLKGFSAALALLLVSLTLYGCMGSPKTADRPSPGTKIPQTEHFSEEAPFDTAVTESEELTFARTFILALAEASTNIIADDIYEMLSPKLKAEADSFYSWHITRLDNGHHITEYGPFLTADPVIIQESDNVFLYQMLPADSDPKTYRWGDESTRWEGRLVLKRNEAGCLQAEEWENSVIDTINSRTEFLEKYPASILSLLSDSIPTLEEWLSDNTKDNTEQDYYNTYGDPPALLKNGLALNNCQMTDLKAGPDGENGQITCTWKDGSIIFYMKYRTADKIWVPSRM